MYVHERSCRVHARVRVWAAANHNKQKAKNKRYLNFLNGNKHTKQLKQQNTFKINKSRNV